MTEGEKKFSKTSGFCHIGKISRLLSGSVGKESAYSSLQGDTTEATEHTA